MIKNSIKVSKRASISLYGLINRRKKDSRPLSAARAAGFMGQDLEAIHETDPTAVIVEAKNAEAVYEALQKVDEKHAKQVVKLSQHLLSVHAGEKAIDLLLKDRRVQRIQTKKRKVQHLTEASRDIGLRHAPGTARLVQEKGKGVFIGIIDSGFDLSHPMFLDAAGNLRVEALLVQRGDQPPKQYTANQLRTGWANGAKPGADENGHGTHVATIAGGSEWNGFEGVASECRFLLVKTDFINTDKAVRWIYDKAGMNPCVVNMSLGHHWGAHDGTDAEERFHLELSEQNPGKIICISAGNEREDKLHIGGRFSHGQEQTVGFGVFRAQHPGERPYAALTFWHDENDDFAVTLISPDGTEFAAPALGQLDEYQAPKVTIQIGRDTHAWSNLVETQVVMEFGANAHPVRDLQGWKVKFRCVQAVVGRLDGWFGNSGMGRFSDHSLLEEARTVGLSATGPGCIAVASHVTKNVWDSDLGQQVNQQLVLGRSSNFSSVGPTRDGRWKPEISAPGEMVSAALASDSEMALSGDFEGFRHTADRLLTIQGTSMACPVVAGVIALMLQKKPTLTTAQVKNILQTTGRKDAHTGNANWHPSYGHGKVDVAAALAAIP